MLVSIRVAVVDVVYLRARYYDPFTQQFISRDPLEGTTGQPYAYAYGNPVNFVDPTGLEGNRVNPWLSDLMPVQGAQGARAGMEAPMAGSGGQISAVNAFKAASKGNSWTFVGYHGTTSEAAESIRTYGVLDEYYVSNMGEGHLGRGFYTTPSKTAAMTFAKDAVANYNGPNKVRATVLRIMARNVGNMRGHTVPSTFRAADIPDLWIAQYDFLQGPMVGFDNVWQIKFHPQVYTNLRAR